MGEQDGNETTKDRNFNFTNVNVMVGAPRSCREQILGRDGSVWLQMWHQYRVSKHWDVEQYVWCTTLWSSTNPGEGWVSMVAIVAPVRCV